MKRRVDGSVAVSIALHIAFGAFLLWVFSIPYPLREMLERTRPRVAPEQISFISIPNRGETTPGRDGGDGLPERPNRPPARTQPLVAPTETPSAMPPVTPAARQEEVGGSGPLVGRGGPVRGIVPSYSDPRVWTDPNARVLALPRSLSEQLDSMLVSGTQRVRDSIALASGQRKPGDWSWTKDGKKYGWDAEGIHLGGVTIPNAILGLGAAGLVQGGLLNGAASNPQVADRARTIRAMTQDINYNAPRAMNAEEFRTAVKRIRERKERERREAREESEKKAKEQKSAAP